MHLRANCSSPKSFKLPHNLRHRQTLINTDNFLLQSPLQSFVSSSHSQKLTTFTEKWQEPSKLLASQPEEKLRESSWPLKLHENQHRLPEE
ncbi:hypothetical protein L2E82_47186 [Cichorium intybus]|uniref:Uncharacterized protein n=1 Tax=Cichorium intybus TaxID=13427 RepID=A0ACB8YV26_CICIN|nr:hypothetical protein L2E82_47186 [Cichorium intybus]